jgi:hypothetical protein
MVADALEDEAEPELLVGAVPDWISPRGVLGAGRKLFAAARGLFQGKSATGAASFTAKQFGHFERQLAQHGTRALETSRRSIEGRLASHLQKLEEVRKAGGRTSSLEREIRTFRGDLAAIDELLRRIP